MTGKENSLFIYKMARYGAVAIGVVYAAIGVVAILSLLRLKDGGADEAGILNFIEGVPLGKPIIILIFLGLVAFVTWKFYNAIKDPYGYGKSLKGVVTRLSIGAGAIAYGFICVSAVEAFLGLSNNTDGQPYEQRLMVSKVFQWWAGEWLVAILGALVGITGLAQFYFVIKRGYREKFSQKQLSKQARFFIDAIAWLGHFARGVILLIIAWFLIKAAFQSDPSEVVNTDKAFNFLGEQVSHFAFVAVAVGTVCYGVYMFALSYHYDFRDDF